MDIEKHQKSLTIGNLIALLGVAGASVGFVMANAEDMTQLKTQMPAIVKAQEKEAEHQKERFETVKKDIEKIEAHQDELRGFMIEILQEVKK